MTTIQLLYLYITKLYLGATGNQSSRSNVGIIEIELKESSLFGFDSPVEDSGTIEDIVEPPYFKVFVKRSGNFCRSILLVKYNILYSIYSFFPSQVGPFSFSLWSFQNFSKKWAIQLTPSRRSAAFTPSNLGLRLSNWCQCHK